MSILTVLNIFPYVLIWKYVRIWPSISLRRFYLCVPHISNMIYILSRIPFYFPQYTNSSGSYRLLRNPNLHIFPNTIMWIVDSLSSIYIAHLGYYPWNFQTWHPEVDRWSSHPPFNLLVIVWYSLIHTSLGQPKNLCWCASSSYCLKQLHSYLTVLHFGYPVIYQTH